MPTSRRRFLETLAGSSAFVSLNGGVASVFAESAASFSSESTRAFAYVASDAGAADSSQSRGLNVFEVREDRWILKQRIESNPVAALALHPSGQSLYTVGDGNKFAGLPRGAVEAYKIDSRDRTVTFVSRQDLSLSATGPRHVAVAPGGDYLAVAVNRGGAYNLVPISPSGDMGPVMARWKETGCGLHPVHQASAHPHTVVFDPSGQHFIATDQGCDRISVFALRDGGLERRQQISAAGGPGHAVLAPSSSLLFVSSTLDDRIDSYRIRESKDAMLEHLSKTDAMGSAARDMSRHDFGGASLALHPRHNILYSANAAAMGGGISVWTIDTAGGSLSHLQTETWNGDRLLVLHPDADGRTLIAVDHEHGCILGFEIDAESGMLAPPTVLARVSHPVGLALKQV